MKTKRKTEAQTTPFHGPNLHPHPHPEHNDDGGAQDEEEEATPYQEAQQDEEVEEEEEEEEEGEEEEVEEAEGEGEGEGERDGEGEGEEQSERPKLDDGYYEIEAIRRRRVRKGQLQYLIKWRGWPENANTWEPLENLQACSDVIDAFEDRMRSKRNRSSRKRKRKSAGSTQTLPKKKQQRSGASNVRGLNFSITDEQLLSPLVNNVGHADIEVVNGAVNNVEMTKESNENGSADVSLQIPQREEDNDSDLKLIELRGSNEGNANKFKIQFQEVKALEGECPMNGHSKVERVETDQSSRRTGARRRKSSSVKRFKKDLVPCEPNDIQNTTTRIQIGSCGRVENPEFPGNDSGLNNKFDGAINMSVITEIIKPISYSASISNDAQDVSVTFMAMRSDGKEVMVDNKFLKANNPLLSLRVMRNRGPSPLVPSLMVGALGLLICGPTLLSLLGSLVLLFQGGGADSEGRFTFSFVMVLLSLLLLVLIQWLNVLFPGRPRCMYSSSAVEQTSSSGYDGGGFGLGTLIMVVLFLILYNLV